jgi:hypothetical protein
LPACLAEEWERGEPVPGSFFSAELFRSLAQSIDARAGNTAHGEPVEALEPGSFTAEG